MSQQVRIKDIAERAGVSVGTVDRVLHGRPNVSESARKKVEKVLNEINYQPNVYASALATNKSSHFFLIMPKHESEAYWEEVEEGAMRCRFLRRDFKVEVETLCYNRFEPATFTKACQECMSNNPDGVIIVPSAIDATKAFTDELRERDIPFVFLDSNIPDLRPLAFFGQESIASGIFAARMLSLIAKGETEIMLMKQTLNGKVASKQQDNREAGFRHYMNDHFPHVVIKECDLPLNERREKYDDILTDFFKANPKVHHCITFNSKAHIVGDYLLRTNKRNIQIMGYDMVGKNAECLRQGSISFLIAQHGYQQGYNCVDALFRAIVLKHEIPPVNYMPIELLTLENIDFYQRKQI